MTTVIAEKPSVARELATLLGATEKRDGYFEGKGYAVTWALGHLVTLGLPEDYDIKGFERSNLPILPSPFVLVPRKGTGKNRLLPDKGTLKQLVTIGHLFAKSESIVVATDAGREGELIFRYIYEYLQCKKPFQRLWVSSLTESALKNGFDNLLPGSHFDNLFYAARARSRADWLVGINATQALSIAAGFGLYSLGRVQTPTLALICERYLKHKEFAVGKYWQLQLSHNKSFTDFKSISVLNWDDRRKAENALTLVQRQNMATITSVKIMNITDSAPLLFDLTGLQKEANTKFGLSASETLEIAQKLYENKFITYPRTGSKYITDDLWAEVPALIKGLQRLSPFQNAVSLVQFDRLNRHIVNEGKVTDHHGLLITGKAPSALSVKEGLVYQMIAFRLMEAVSGAATRESTDISLHVSHYEFSARSSRITEPGWRAIQNDFTGTDEKADALPELKEGNEIAVRDTVILEKETRPPQLYTEASLLAAMEHAGSSIQGDILKKAIKDTGLGTPATRAGILETLFDRRYIKRNGKSLQPTEKGLEVYGLIKDKKIASVQMTAEWEASLSAIEDGSSDVEDFQTDMEQFATSLTAELLENPLAEGTPELVCPKCAAHRLLISYKSVKCTDNSCNWQQWRTVCGMHLPVQELESLIKDRQTSFLKGLKSKSGKSFDARLLLNEASEVVFAFE